MSDKNLCELCDFDDAFYKSQEGEIYKRIISQIERPLFEWVLKKTEGNQIKAAQILGINRNTFRSKLRKLGIDAHAYRV